MADRKTDTKYDRWTRWSYDRLRLLQPHIQTQGLYQKEERFYIHVPNLSHAKAAGGVSLIEWFKGNKAMTSPVELLSDIPEGFDKMADRTPIEIASLAGSPRTISDIATELGLLLGIEFPRFHVRDFPPYKGTVEVERSLTPIEDQKLTVALDSLQLAIIWGVEVKSEFREPEVLSSMPQVQGKIELLTARYPALSKHTKNLQRMMDADEQFWIDSGRKVLAGEQGSAEILPDNWSKDLSTSILNGSTFETDNLRNHICLFEKTNLIFPISQNYQAVLGSLGISERELVSLVAEGGLRIVLPLTMERYPLKILDELAEVAPGQILFPRRLTTGLLENNRKKFPFLFPACSTEARQQFLRAVFELQEIVRGTPLQFVFDIYGSYLRENWSYLEEVYNRRGPLALQTHGIGAMISHFAKAAGKDLFAELGYADLGVSIASTLGSTYFPHEGSDSWSEEGVSALIASVYSGGPGQIISGFQRRLNVVLDGVMSIRKDVPVMELSGAMGSGDVQRLRKMVFQIASDRTVNSEQMAENLALFNKEVAQIEHKQERLAKWDIGSIVLSIPGALVGINEPMIGFLLAALSSRISKEIPALRSRHPVAGSLIDSLEGMILTSHPDKVFLARLRRQIEN